MLSFDPIMNSHLSQSHNPNSCNPNSDPNSSYFDVANYLMSDILDDASDENILMKEDVSQDSSTSLPFATNISKRGRGLKKYNREEDLIRFAFRTKTHLEFMDDGYKWRKYGKKMVKNNPNPRNYFKCSSGGCNVKKRVERDSEDPSFVITTYQGIHNHHSPTYVLYPSPSPSPQPSSIFFI